MTFIVLTTVAAGAVLMRTGGGMMAAEASASAPFDRAHARSQHSTGVQHTAMTTAAPVRHGRTPGEMPMVLVGGALIGLGTVLRKAA